jgi:branched-chain amino acid transport system ATP-binding protein
VTLAAVAAPAALLSVENLHVHLGQSHVLQGVSFEVPEGQVTALLGRNGVGKTTTLRALMGLVDRKGTIELAGDDIRSTRTHKIVRRGVGYVPEDRDVFSTLTVDENLRLAERDAEPRYDLVYDLFPELRTRGKQAAGTLSGGQQQMLAIGRALMARPKLLLLDEPSMGIAPILVDRIYETIAEINRQGTTILLVEQNANYALGVSVRGYVLETGKVALTDASDALRTNPDVQKAYLGA